MNQTLKTLLLAVVCFLVGAGAFYAWSTMDALKKENERLSGQLPAESAGNTADSTVGTATDVADLTMISGNISGTLGFPAGGIPPLAVYAYQAEDHTNYSSLLTAQNQTSFTFENLEPGDYVLVAYTLDGALMGGYTEAVPCGLSVACTDHSLISVTVTAGETSEAEIKDWYAPEGTFPAKPK